MRVCHGFTANFDDPNLVSCAGLAPVLGLAERSGLQRLVARHVRIGQPAGVNADRKIASLVAGMVAGADSIDDMALLRHAGMRRLFTGVRAPSTLGTFLRSFTFGHVRQLDAVASRLLIDLAGRAPLLPGADQVAYIDIDDTVRRTYGYAKQGAGRGYTGVKGLNALLAIVSTPTCAPVIAASRLRKGSTTSARGAARFVADALVTAKGAGATGVRIVRADSAFYGYAVIAAATRAGARFSITARQNRAVRKAIAAIDDQGWTPIRYPNAIYDEDQQRWISDAEVAEIPYTAFTSRRKAQHVTARLIVRRVPDLNPANQSELFTVYRYHAVFTNTERPGRLGSDAWLHVRLHAYHSEQILARSVPLAPLAMLAGMHHERLDGSGYHRNAQAAQIPMSARVLAAADVYQALISERPHRRRYSPTRAAGELRTMTRAGQLDHDAVEAVLSAASDDRAIMPGRGGRAGLTERQIEVLALVAEGLSNRAIAESLTISTRTAEHHVQDLYARIGVSSRAAAAMYAMEHGLLRQDA